MANWPNYSEWEPWDVDFLKQYPYMANLYETGHRSAPISWYFGGTEFYDLLMSGGMNFVDLMAVAGDTEWFREQGVTGETYNTFVEDWKANYIAENKANAPEGTPDYLFDPTPWDATLTEEDIAIQDQLKANYLAEHPEYTEDASGNLVLAPTPEPEPIPGETVSVIEGESIAQQESDIETIFDLAGYREQSEALAYEDISEYVDKTTEFYKLRGVWSEFTPEDIEGLVTTRMEDYWSLENETLLSDLMTKYQGTGLELPTLSGRSLFNTGIGSARENLYSLLG